VEEVLSFLPRPEGAVYVDGTVGGGGHALRILEETPSDARLIGIDRDDEALGESEERLRAFRGRVVLIRGDFADMETFLGDLGIRKVDGILLDLGVSSHQLEQGERGFGFSRSGPLDMRMDRREGKTAFDLVHGLSEEDLRDLLYRYGEEGEARGIARAIAARRRESVIESTSDLAGIVSGAVSPRRRHGKRHPATKTFQALRIAVNRELESLRKALDGGGRLLNRGGRFLVISYHSLEDRMVKESFRLQENPCICPPGFPRCVCGRQKQGVVLTKRPLVPREEEVRRNPRARSARLRVMERI
jgi:16S rRNA (cytosine1402-N4)-methyltransferase